MCEDCGRKGHHIAEDRGQEVVKGKEWEELKKCGECSRKEREKAAHGQETQKVQLERGILKGKFKELSKC